MHFSCQKQLKLRGAGLCVMAALLSVDRGENVINQDEVVKCRRRWSLKDLTAVSLCSYKCE